MMSSKLDIQNKVLAEKRHKMLSALCGKLPVQHKDSEKAHINQLKQRRNSIFNLQNQLIAN